MVARMSSGSDGAPDAVYGGGKSRKGKGVRGKTNVPRCLTASAGVVAGEPDRGSMNAVGTGGAEWECGRGGDGRRDCIPVAPGPYISCG